MCRLLLLAIALAITTMLSATAVAASASAHHGAKITDLPLSVGAVAPFGIAPGPRGDGANAIARVNRDGHSTRYPVPTPDSDPLGMVVGPDGALWFTERAANKGAVHFAEFLGDRIGRLDFTGAFTVDHDISTRDSCRVRIASGPCRTLGVSEQQTDRIGRHVVRGGGT